jgi:hypothetical protein
VSLGEQLEARVSSNRPRGRLDLARLVAVAVALLGCGSGTPLGTGEPPTVADAVGAGGSSASGAAGTGDAAGIGGTAGLGAAGGAGGTTSTAGAGGGSSSTAGSTGSAGAGSTSGLPCVGYCNTIMANCTGANQQYRDMTDCMKACAFMPAGVATDVTGNTAACRANRAAAAANDTIAIKPDCFLAGPLGYGGCGYDCDLFCTIALNYCSAAYGYAGTPPYKSMDDCEATCGQFNSVVDFGAPGAYRSSYTPGMTPETTDTLECRAYHLIVNALADPTAQTTDCPQAANTSASCGAGVVALGIGEGGSTGSDGAVIVPYDGGAGGDSSWDETKYPPSKRKMLLRDEGDPHLVMIDLSRTPILQWKTVAGGPWARSAQLVGGNQILGGRNDGYEVFDYTTGLIVKNVTAFANTQSAYRLATGETMLTRSGTVLTFLDKNDTVSRQISYPGFGFVRVARPTRNGTFLVPSDTTLFEGDASGNVLWKATRAEWREIWQAQLLGPPATGSAWNDGDALVCSGYGASCDVVDKRTHAVTFRFGTKQMPLAATVAPNFFAEFEILPNGNLVTSNWQGDGPGNGASGLQVLEFDPLGKLVWFWKQDPTNFSSIQGVQVMDGKDPRYLYVQEWSRDGTWQPVIPTP